MDNQLIYFILSTLLFGFLIIYFIFYSSFILGFIVSKALSFAVGKSTYISIGSMNYSLLTGHILFRNVVYATKDASIRIVDGALTFRWWRTNIRRTLQNAEPCRLEFNLTGVEFLLYNNSSRYEFLQSLLQRRNSNGNVTLDINEVTKMLPVHLFKKPWYYRIFPAIGFSFYNSCVYIGNPNIPKVMVFTFAKGSGIMTTEKASNSLDYYREIFQFEFQTACLNIVPNHDYVGERLSTRTTTGTEDFVQHAFESLKAVKSTFQDIRFKAFRGGNPTNYGSSYLTISHTPDENWQGLSRYRNPDYNTKENVLKMSSISICYQIDRPGPIQAYETVFDPSTAPQWKVDITCTGTELNYGPWINNQRALIQKWFFPFEYENRKIYQPVPGSPREYAAIQATLSFIETTRFTIPFSEFIEGGSENHSWFAITSVSPVHFKIVHPWVATTNNGITSKIDLEFENVTFTTSLTPGYHDALPFLKAKSFKISGNLNFPNVWNALTEWFINLYFDEVEFFIIYRYIMLLQSLAKHWSSSGEETDLVHFIPSKYNIKFGFSNFKMFLNANEYNIINKLNDEKENTHFIFSGPHLDFSLSLNFTQFQPQQTFINFDIRAKEITLKLQLPSHSPITQHLDVENQGGNFVTAENLVVHGTYSYHSGFHPTFVDSLKLDVSTNNVVVTLFGHYLHFLLNLKNNYFGTYQSFVSSVSQLKEKQLALEQAIHSDSEDSSSVEETSNGFEVYLLVKVDNVVAQLPLGLYSSEEKETIKIQQVLLDLRHFPTYLDFYASLYPITMQTPSGKKEDTTYFLFKSLGNKNGFLTITDVTVKFHYLFGPRPQKITYCEKYALDIGNINGHISLLQLTNLGKWIKQLNYHFSCLDESLGIPKKISYPYFVTIKLRLKTLFFCLWGKQGVTEIKLPQGLVMDTVDVIHKLYNDVHMIEIPHVSFKHLIRENSAKGSEYWIEVGRLDGSFSLGLYSRRQESNKGNFYEKQIQFLTEQDAEEKRLLFLWNDVQLNEESNEIFTDESEEEELETDESEEQNEEAEKTSQSSQEKGKVSLSYSLESSSSAESSPKRKRSVKDSKGEESEESFQTADSSFSGSEKEEDDELKKVSPKEKVKTSLTNQTYFRLFTLKVPNLEYTKISSKPIFSFLQAKSRKFRFANQNTLEERDTILITQDYLASPVISSFQKILEKQSAKPSSFAGKNKKDKKKDRNSSLRKSRWLKDVTRREKELTENGSQTRTIVVDAIRDIEVMLTPSILSSVEEFLEILRNKPVSYEDLLDEVQLDITEKKFSSQKSPFVTTQICLSVDVINLYFLNLPDQFEYHSIKTDKLFLSQVSTKELMCIFSLSTMQFVETTLNQKTQKTEQIQKKETYSCDWSVNLGNLHVSIGPLDQGVSSSSNQGPFPVDAIPPITLDTKIVNCFGKYKFYYPPYAEKKLGRLAVQGVITEISVYLAENGAPVGYSAIHSWIVNASKIQKEAEHLQKVRENQLLTAIEQLILSASKNPEDKVVKLGTEYEDLIGEQAINHRKIWQDISYLRYYGEIMGPSKRTELNQLLQKLDRTASLPKQRFYQLVENVDHADYGTTVIEINQSNFIRQIFKIDKSRPQINLEIDFNFQLPLIKIDFLDPSIDGQNDIILEKILLAGTSRTQSYDKEDELDINCIMEIVNLKIQFTPQIIKFIQTIIFQTKEEPSKKIERTVGKNQSMNIPFKDKSKTPKLPPHHVSLTSTPPLFNSHSMHTIESPLKTNWAVDRPIKRFFNSRTNINWLPPSKRRKLKIKFHLSGSLEKCHIRAVTSTASMNFIIDHLRIYSSSLDEESQKPEIGQLLHTTLVNISKISLNLKRKKKKEKQIINLTMNSIALNHVLVKKRALNLDKFYLAHDINMLISSIDIPFALSQLPSTKPFFLAWQEAYSISKPASDRQTIPSLKLEEPVEKEVTEIYFKLDTRKFNVWTEDKLPFLFRYELPRITVNFYQYNFVNLDCSIGILNHKLIFISDKQAHNIPREFNLPFIKAVLHLKKQSDTQDQRNITTRLKSQLDIGTINNVVNPHLLTDFLMLQSSFTKHINKLLDKFISYAEKRGAPIKAPTGSHLKELPLEYEFNLFLHGLEVQATSPEVILVIQTGKIHVEFKSSKLTADAQTDRSFTAKVSLTGTSIFLKNLDSSNVKGKIRSGNSPVKRNIWAGLETNITAQSYPPHNLEFAQPPKPQDETSSKVSLDSIWLLVSKTTVTLQPAAIDKAILLWMYYYKAYTNLKAQRQEFVDSLTTKRMKRAFTNVELPTSSIPIKGRNLATSIRITETSIWFPFIEDATESGCSALLVALETFSLSGYMGKSKVKDKSSRYVFGKCSFSKASTFFGERYSFINHQIFPKSSQNLNRAVIMKGFCDISTSITPKIIKLCIELNTEGLLLDIDSNIVPQLTFLKRALYSGQRKWKIFSESEEYPQNPTPTSTNESDDILLTVDFKLITDFGLCHLHTSSSHSSSSQFLLDPSPNIEPTSIALERVPFPPISLLINHVSSSEPKDIPSKQTKRESCSQTNIKLELESSQIKFTPNLGLFINEVIDKIKLIEVYEEPEIEKSTKQEPDPSTVHPYLTGSRTIIFRLSLTEVEFSCLPTSDVSCRFAVGPIEIFISSVVKKPQKALDHVPVLLNNATVNWKLLSLTLHHPLYEDKVDNSIVGIHLKNIRANFGQAYGIRLDQGAVLSILFDVDSIQSNVHLVHFDEFFLFYHIWIATLLNRRQEIYSTNLSKRKLTSTKLVKPESKPTLQEWLSMLLQGHIKKIEFKGILGNSIGDVELKLQNISTRFGFPGRLQASALEDMSFVSAFTGPFTLECKGNLEGYTKIDGIILKGNHHGSHHFHHLGINKWALQVSPIQANLSYNVSPIVLLRSGSILARVRHDHDQLIFENELNISSLEIQLSCETISSFLVIYHRIAENISEKWHRSVKIISKVHRIDLRTSQLIMLQPVKTTPTTNRLPPFGNITVKTGSVNLSFFMYNLCDPSCAFFNCENIQLSLAQSVKKNGDIHRQLSIGVGKHYIAKIIEKDASGNQKPGVTRKFNNLNATQTKIFVLPITTILMYSIEKESKELEFYFLTDFSDPIVVSLDISLYTYLKEIAQLYTKTVKDAIKSLQNNKENIESKSSEEDKRVFLCKNFQLAPTLSFLGDSTPSLEKVFRWLGVKDINKSIPRATHIGITQPLETVLKIMWEIIFLLHKIDSQI